MKSIRFPKTLRDAVRDGHVVPFVGMGPSCLSGLPVWNRIFQSAVDRLLEEERHMEAETLQKYIISQDVNFSEALRSIRQKLGLFWKQFLLHSFTPTSENIMCNKIAIQKSIWKLSNGLVITTNYDPLLEVSSPSRESLEIATVKKIEQQLSAGLSASLTQKLWPLLGRITDINNLIFTADGMNPVFFDPAVFNYLHDCRFLIRQIASHYTIIFIGTSVPLDWHSWTNQIFKDSPRMHYWLSNNGHARDLQGRLNEQDLPIQIISYESHEELGVYLEELANIRSDGSTESLSSGHPVKDENDQSVESRDNAKTDMQGKISIPIKYPILESKAISSSELISDSKTPPTTKQKADSIINIFVSYSHKDVRYLNALKPHLTPLTQGGKIDIWDDSRIRAGDLWKDEIQNALNKATVGILLISKHFLSSEFIVNNELPPLLNAAKSKGTLILQVVISPCLIPDTLNKFQMINRPNESITKKSHHSRELIYMEVAKRIKSLMQRIEQPERV